jgi:post-segregation antitoxin (ccd killing protein)
MTRMGRHKPREISWFTRPCAAVMCRPVIIERPDSRPLSSRRILGRMPRLQVYLPDDLYEELKRRDLPASELLQVAVRAELERRDVLEATDEYLTELAAEVGEPTARQRSRADAIVRRIRDRHLHDVG